MARKRSNINAFSQLLGTCAAPVYVVDAQRRIIYCNAALTQWLQVEPRQLMGAVCNYHSGGPDQFDPSLLCPPPEAFAGQPQEALLVGARRDGSPVSRRARFVPLPLGESGPAAVLAVLQTPGAAVAADQMLPPADHAALHAELRRLVREIGVLQGLEDVIGYHPAVVRAREVIRLAAGSDLRALVVGPPGSGREHVARAVHYAAGQRESAPLAPLACNLLDAELLEETVSSFVASCADLQIERPPGLLLLEIDQLPADAQRALAGVLSIGELNVRTVATAGRRLLDLAAEDRFREDLAFSLSTLEILLPPLSARRNDIPLLAQFLLEKRNAAGGKQLSGFSREALEQLVAYSWPGNVDELSEVVSAAWAAAAGPLVLPGDLPPRLELAARVAQRPPAAQETIELDKFLGEVEQELLRRALRRAKGKRARAARLLGISRARLIRRLQHFGMTPGAAPADVSPSEGG